MRCRRRIVAVRVVCAAAVIAVTGLVIASEQRSASGPRIVERFDFDWRFMKDDPGNAQEPDFDDLAWRQLNVPHDWSIEESPSSKQGAANGFFPGGIGWYRKHFSLPKEYGGKKVFLQFDGVYHRSDVYLNGKHLGHRPYGYVSFQYDLTPHLRFDGENVLAVRVDHSDCPTSRWYSGSGIYRHVWLTATDPVHVAHWGTYITTPQAAAQSATVRVRTTVSNQSNQPGQCTLVTAVVEPGKKAVAQSESSQTIPAGSSVEFDQTLAVASPRLWSVQEPNLYTARTTVKLGDRIVDEYDTPFGIRQTRFDPQKGFFLNGKSLKFKGVCLHHDAGCVGAAVPDRVLERRLKVLKELGCNAIRTSHNPPAPELLDMADRLGFLVLDEVFDKWATNCYYANSFHQWWQRDLDAMLLRDRNHPSIVIWSVGNEVAEQGTPEGARILKMLVDHVHRQEPSRPATYASYPNHDGPMSINFNGFGDPLDIAGYNYQEQWYPGDARQYPQRCILGTECYPYFRGRSDFGATRKVNKVDCAFEATNPWYDVAKHDYVMGQFIWTGIDYLGESCGWPSKGFPSGVIDSCGFPKPQSGFHRSVWKSEPMVKIVVLDDALDIDPGPAAWSWPRMAAHWNFPHYRDRAIRVETFSNCPTVELLLNGDSWGVRRPADYPNSTILWYVPYRPGRLQAIAVRDGKEVARDELRTAGDPAKIVLLPDRTRLAADGQDVAHVEARLVDAEGILVPHVDRLVQFAVKGPAVILGVDNGDLRSSEPYKGSQRTTHWGRCLALLQSTRHSGPIVVEATAPGLPPAKLTIDTNSANESVHVP